MKSYQEKQKKIKKMISKKERKKNKIEESKDRETLDAVSMQPASIYWVVQYIYDSYIEYNGI